MKVRHILFATTAILALTACEDYTEHNFGKSDELYQPTETGVYSFSLSKADYPTVAANEENIAKAIEMGRDTLDPNKVDSSYYYALQQVGENKCFNPKATGGDFVAAILDSKIPYATDGAQINVTVKEDTLPFITYPCFERVTMGFVNKGKYLLVPEGIDYCLSSTELDGTGLIEGKAITRHGNKLIAYTEDLDNSLINCGKSGSTCYLSNVEGGYLCGQDNTANILFCEETDELDDMSQAVWNVSYNKDTDRHSLVNAYNEKGLYWNTIANAAGLYADTEDGIVPIQAYHLVQSGTVSETSIKKTVYSFVKTDGKWVLKDSYLDQTLTGTTSTSASDIKSLTGWTLANVDMPNTLTYVWALNSTYGLKASAYANSTNNATEAWAITPEIDLSSATKPYIQFDQAQKYAGTVEEELTLWVTTDKISDADDIDPESYTWTQVTIPEYPDGSSWTYLTTQVDLSQFIGQPNVRLGFRYVSTASNSATWELKNVVIKNAK